MKNSSKITIGYTKINSLLEEFGIEYMANRTKPIKLNPSNVTSMFYNEIRRGRYADGYKECRNRYDYDFLLTNGDIFLFEMWQDKNHDVTKLFYLFLESPYQISTYNEYLTNNGLSYTEVGDSLLESYFIESDNFQKKEDALKIHYDYFPKDHVELVHPASHIHFGNNDDVRIPIKGVWSPVEFVCMCLKFTKYDRWKNAIKAPTFFNIVVSQKSNTSKLEDCFFSHNDGREFHLA